MPSLLKLGVVHRWFGLLALGLCAAESLAASVPKPYTPVEATAGEFRCLGRDTTLGDLLLPTQITSAGKALLADRIRLVSSPDVFAAVKMQAALVENTGETARWKSTGDSADLRVTVTMSADCDGFCWYEIQLAPKHPIKLASLALEIPRVASTARYLHTANASWSNVSGGLAELGGKWSGAFVPYVWLGDEDRGLAWCAESSAGWELSAPGNALSVQTHGDVVLFKANLIDHEESIAAPVTYRFGLQASPVKPVSFAWRANARILHDIHYDSAKAGPDGRCELDTLRDGGVKTVVIHDSWTKYFGQMVPADADAFRQLIDACHQRKLRLLVYVGYGVARSAPDLVGHHDAWSVLPLIPWVPTFKPETRAFDATCANSGWADWLVAGTEKLFADYKLDGLYFDGTANPWVCENQSHGCGWKDADGKVHPTYPLFATRRLMRRMADTVHRHDPDAILDVHMSSNFILPTLSFCDSVWNGEQFEVFKAADKFQVPLPAFRAQFMGYAEGLDAEFLCYENRPFTFDEAIALAWVHGVEVRPYPDSLAKVTPIWRAMDRFGTSQAQWHPYWSQKLATADSDATKVSAWTRDGKALLLVSHLTREPATVHVRVDAKALGIGKLNASDALTSRPIAVVGENIELKFDGMRLRMVEVGG